MVVFRVVFYNVIFVDVSSHHVIIRARQLIFSLVCRVLDFLSISENSISDHSLFFLANLDPPQFDLME